MNTIQLQTLKTAILADPNLTDLVAQFATGAIRDYLREDSTFVVWRKDVPISEIMQNGFNWAEVDNLSVGKARIWEWLKDQGFIEPYKLNVRDGIDECWKGTAGKLAVRDQIYTHCKRFASIAEALFATGTGTTEVPGNLVLDNIPSEYDVVQALTQV